MNNERHRLSLDLTITAKDELEKLAADAGCSTYAETFRRAMALLRVFADHEKAGGKVIFRYEDGREETLKIL